MKLTDLDGFDLMRFTFGSESNLNILGKVVFSPAIITFGLAYLLIEILFTKRKP